MENKRKFKPNPDLKLMDQVRQVLSYHHYAYRTEKAYCDWIVRYIKYFGAKKHPRDMGKTEIETYLSHCMGSPQRHRGHGDLILFIMLILSKM